MNQMFESQMAYVVYDNGLGNILGRDIVWFMLGFLVACVLGYLIQLVRWKEDEYRKAGKRSRKKRTDRDSRKDKERNTKTLLYDMLG